MCQVKSTLSIRWLRNIAKFYTIVVTCSAFPSSATSFLESSSVVSFVTFWSRWSTALPTLRPSGPRRRLVVAEGSRGVNQRLRC